MSITSIQKGIGSTLGSVFESIKNTAIWSGHQISKGFNKLIDLLKAAWNKIFPYIKNFAMKIGAFLRTSTGMGVLLGTISLGLGLSANRIKDKTWLSIALQISSFALAIASGAFLGYGFATQSACLF